MKTIKSLFAVCIVFIGSYSCIQGQNSSSDKKNIQILKDFYTSYITYSAIDTPGTFNEKKLDSLQKIYCTEALLKKIPEISEHIDADPFTKAQLITIKLLNTLAIKKDSNKLNQYVVSYSFDPPIIIHIAIVKDKIDSVW